MTTPVTPEPLVNRDHYLTLFGFVKYLLILKETIVYYYLWYHKVYCAHRRYIMSYDISRIQMYENPGIGYI